MGEQINFWDILKSSPRLIFLEDYKHLHKSFVKGAVFEYYEENESNWFIWFDNCTYGPLKYACNKVV